MNPCRVHFLRKDVGRGSCVGRGHPWVPYTSKSWARTSGPYAARRWRRSSGPVSCASQPDDSHLRVFSFRAFLRFCPFAPLEVGAGIASLLSLKPLGFPQFLCRSGHGLSSECCVPPRTSGNGNPKESRSCQMSIDI